MNTLDIFLLIPLLYGLYSGFSKGLIQQLTGLIGIIVALLFGLKASTYVNELLLANQIVNESWAAVVGFAITFLGIIIMVKIIGLIAKKTTQAIGLGFIEKFLGGIFGTIKAVLILFVLLFFFVKINHFAAIVPETMFQESMLFPYYELGFDYLNEFWKPETSETTNITFS